MSARRDVFMLALYHFGPVSNSMTPLLCLKEKGLEFEDRFLNSGRWEHHDPAFQKISPEGMVPVLVHDGKSIIESTVINEYLDEVFPEMPLKPADPYGRAQMRVWTKYVDEYFYPAITMLGAQFATAFASKWDEVEKKKILARMPNDEVRKKWATVTSKGYTEEQLEDSRRRLRTVVQRMERSLKEMGDWLAGPYSLADIKNYSMAQHLERSIPDACTEETTPRSYEWLRRMEERPAVKAARAMARQPARS